MKSWRDQVYPRLWSASRAIVAQLWRCLRDLSSSARNCGTPAPFERIDFTFSLWMCVLRLINTHPLSFWCLSWCTTFLFWQKSEDELRRRLKECLFGGRRTSKNNCNILLVTPLNCGTLIVLKKKKKTFQKENQCYTLACCVYFKGSNTILYKLQIWFGTKHPIIGLLLPCTSFIHPHRASAAKPFEDTSWKERHTVGCVYYFIYSTDN